MSPDLTLSKWNDSQRVVQICNENDVVEYLGMPLGTRRLSKMKFNSRKVTRITKILKRLDNSGLKISQVINAIKTFILPRLDYGMTNTMVNMV